MTLLLAAALYTEIPDESTLSLLSPDMKERKTVKMVLNNGVQVLLVSDPAADQSSAAVSVGTGSWNDPEEYPGMAHFCEHMLFLGTAKYPDPNEFMTVVGDFGGQSNAFTANDRTVYMFSCKHEGFLDNLDRFSHFFIDPLFDTRYVAREMHAVDQEFSKNLENDRWREYMIFKELCNPDHPQRKFSTGNSDTLKGIPSSRLIEWHKENYGAENTRVFIYSALPEDLLKEKVSAYFNEVPKLEMAETVSYGPILNPKMKDQIVYIKPIVDQQILSICWELSADQNDSAELIAYALNRGQEYSLQQQLKKEELVNSLQLAVEDMGNSNRFFYALFDLTEKGVSDVDSVIKRYFEAIAGLKSTGIPEYLFTEKNAIARLSYQYQSRDDAFQMARKIGESISKEDLSTYPRKLLLGETYSPEKIAETLQLLASSNCFISLAASTEVEPDLTEKWFKAEYAIRPIQKDWLAQWKEAKPNEKIRLAEANPYIPTKLERVAGSEKTPVLISEAESGIAYYCRSPEFSNPEAAIHLHIRSPLIQPTAKSTVLSALYVDHLTDQLNPTLTAAASAGLSTEFTVEKLKLHIQISGFSEKAPLLLREILRQMPENPPTKEQFQLYFARQSQTLANAEKALPVMQGLSLLDSLLVEEQFTSQEKLSALQSLKYEDLLQFHQELFQKTYAEALFAGNLTLQEAQSSWIDVQHILSHGTYPKNEQVQSKVLELTQGPFSLPQTTQAMGNATLLSIDAGPFSFTNRAAHEILGSALREAFFNELRTKQKTGYIAKAEPREIEERLFHLFLVQSNSHNPSDLLYRFELFFEEYLQSIDENVSLARFETLKHSAIQSLKTRFRNLKDKSALWDLLAFEKRGAFNYVDDRIAALEALSYDDFKEYATETLARKNSKRVAILYEGKVPSFSYREMQPAELRQLGKYVTKKD